MVEMEEERINFFEGNRDYSTDMPVWKAALLIFGTLSVYTAFWVYFNLRLLDFLKKRDHSYTLFVTIIAYIEPSGIILYPVLFYLFYNIFKLNDEEAFVAHILKSLILLAIMYFTSTDYAYDNHKYWMLIITFSPFLVMQHELNKYFKKHK